jgi:hypothetical protein
MKEENSNGEQKQALHLCIDEQTFSLSDIIYYVRNEGFYIIPLQVGNFVAYYLVCEYQREWEDYYQENYAEALELGLIGEPIFVNPSNFHELKERFYI